MQSANKFSYVSLKCSLNIYRPLFYTIFDLSECTPSAYYNFNKDLLDHSGHKVSAGFLRVWLTKNGTAKFTEQSRINIWRFAGVDYGTKLYIAFRFLKYSQGPKNQVLITNCNGHRGQGPSVSVFSVGDKLVMTIKTQSSSTGRLAFTMVSVNIPSDCDKEYYSFG